MRRGWLLFGLLTWTTCGGASPIAPTDNEPPVLIGAGDIGDCGSNGAAMTGRLLDAMRGTIFALGDLAYPSGTADQFRDCYDPHWGRHKLRTRPSPGNHDYESPGAAPYFAYFGANAGAPALGYYAYRVGTWDVFSLNSHSFGSHRTTQVTWLSSQLARGATRCTVAYFHHPLFSSGPHGQNPPQIVVHDFWRELYAGGVDLVISAHEHLYERFAPQDPNGRPDANYGIRQFIVGTGGGPLSRPVRRVAQSEIALSTYGVLRLNLDERSYRWDFVSADSGGVLDSGSGVCHDKPDPTSVSAVTK